MRADNDAKEASRRTAVHRKPRRSSCAASRMGRPVPASSSELPPLTKTWPCMPSARGASKGSCAQGLALSLAPALAAANLSFTSASANGGCSEVRAAETQLHGQACAHALLLPALAWQRPARAPAHTLDACEFAVQPLKPPAS